MNEKNQPRGEDRTQQKINDLERRVEEHGRKQKESIRTIDWLESEVQKLLGETIYSVEELDRWTQTRNELHGRLRMEMRSLIQRIEESDQLQEEIQKLREEIG